MNNKLKAFSVALCAMAAGYSAQAQSSADEKPAIVFHTTIYDTYGEENDFSIVLGANAAGVGQYIDVDFGFGTQEVELEAADYDTDNEESTGTFISCRVSKEGIVKIYCEDPTWIDWADFTGCYIDDITFNGTTNIVYLNLSHNELPALDLSDLTNIQALFVSDNTFSKSPLVIGPKPYLTLLEMNNIGAISSSFDLKDYPYLGTLDAWNAQGLTAIDPSGCPQLQKLSIDGTDVAKLDVSNNSELQILNISDTRITEIDVTKNAKLTQLFCTHESSINSEYKIKKLDVTQNPLLYYLFCTGNDLTELDVTNNPYLGSLTARKNLLTSIDVSNNSELFCLNISDNYFGYSNLPWPYPSYENTTDELYTEYDYAQRDMVLDKSYAVGTEIDFSDKVIREHTDTEAVLYTVSESDPDNPVLVDESVYSFDRSTGILKINSEYADSVYVSFSNSIFSAYDLKTTKFKIKSKSEYGKPTKVFSMTTGLSSGSALSFNVGIEGASATEPKKFYIDLGDDKLVECTAKTSDASENNVNLTAKGSYICLYTEDGVDISALAVKDVTLYSVDLSLLRSLRELSLVNTGLYTVDMQWNRCLQKIDLSHNKLSTNGTNDSGEYVFTIKGNNQSYGKNTLTDLDLSYNNISDFDWNENYTIERLNIAHNNLSSITLTDNTKIESLDISYNSFTSFTCADCSALTSLNVEGNQLSSITLPDENIITNLNVSNNKFTLATLPEHGSMSESNYIYAPQADYSLPNKAPGVNLSKQNVNLHTTFTWKNAADGSVATSDHVYCDGGQTWFNEAYAGEKLYCEMTNTDFPAFTGDNVYKTTAIETASMPNNVVAQFTIADATEEELSDNPDLNTNVTLTLTSAVAGNSIYIDWAGDGNVNPYELATNYTIFEIGSVTAGATVTVYSYDVDDNITVFSLRNAKLSSFNPSENSFSKLICLNLTNAGLDKINYPNSKVLSELILEGNNLTSFDFNMYPNLTYVNLSNNKLSDVDFTNTGLVQQLFLGGNNLTSAKFGLNGKLWNLYLNNNELTELSIGSLLGLQQLIVNGNNLTQLSVSRNTALRVLYANDNLLESIDVSKLKNLGVLELAGNRFKFSTLPLESDVFTTGSIYTYEYSSQAPIKIVDEDGFVDLSSEANINGTETVYTWVVGEPDFDSDGVLANEEILYVTDNEYGEDPEYRIDNGVTRFFGAQTHIACVLTNDLFPNLTLQTTLINTGGAAVNDIVADSANVYVDVDGTNVYAYAPNGNIAKLYSVNGALQASAATADGVASFKNVAPGYYLVTVANKAIKIIVK
jgi:hypothetical protein